MINLKTTDLDLIRGELARNFENSFFRFLMTGTKEKKKCFELAFFSHDP
jgi:hypothetical protein